MTAPTFQIRDHISIPRKRKTLIGRIGRILLVLSILLVLLATAGLLYQGIASYLQNMNSMTVNLPAKKRVGQSGPGATAAVEQSRNQR